MIAGDGALNWQSNSPDYYQSSRVVLNREVDFTTIRLYRFGFSKAIRKSSFPIFIIYKSLKEVLTLQVKISLQLCKFFHQKIISFVKQAVFVNETIYSANFNTSLYTA